MFNYPQPPSPPPNTREWLEQLADYYRQLVEYHQRAAMTAMNGLTHIEVLLNPVSPPTTQSSWLEETESEDKQHTHSQTTEIQFPSSPLASGENNLNTMDESLEVRALDDRSESGSILSDELTASGSERDSLSLGSPAMMTEKIREILEFERGKIIHLSYLMRKLYPGIGALQPGDVQEWVRFVLKSGEEIGRWYAVPDAPDCWTFDLKSLEAETSTTQESLTTRELAQRLGTTIPTIHRIRCRKANQERLKEGEHYLVDQIGNFHWQKPGIELITDWYERE
ncbi:MAG: hypothetical protein N5P05_004128 (plasmid) [Chroococcopsis gigantea SAG 12.99]|jgi:hypothetical protein|nr:hypothetical protein [Chroococcopsis gigantea SAG 12.99]